MNLTLLQLADSSFPTGGFAHSGGLEAAWQSGEAGDLSAWVEQALWQAGFAGLPFVGAGYDQPRRLARLDEACDAFLSNPVAKRASRRQGQAFLAACAAAFPNNLNEGRRPSFKYSLSAWAARPVHLAPALGAAAAVLALEREEALQLYLYTTLRGTLSAAVRLGICGPLEAQRIQAVASPMVERISARCARLGLEDAAQTAPLQDLFQGAHDRIYSRLFQS